MGKIMQYHDWVKELKVKPQKDEVVYYKYYKCSKCGCTANNQNFKEKKCSN